MECLGDLVGSDLARRIRRLRLQGMRLVDRHLLRRAVDLARRRMDDEIDVSLARSIENVERSDDVRVDVGTRRCVRMRDGDQRRKVEDDVHAGGRGTDAVRIAYVAENDVHLGTVRRIVQPTP